MKNANEIFAGKPEGKKPLVIRNLRWNDNFKMYLIEVRELEG
jgi:hypothetical protein